MIPSRPCTFSSLEVSCGIVMSLDHLCVLAVVFTVLVNGELGYFLVLYRFHLYLKCDVMHICGSQWLVIEERC